MSCQDCCDRAHDPGTDPAATPSNPVAANTASVRHPITWMDAAGDAVDAAEEAQTLEHPYLDVLGATAAEAFGRELGMAQGQAARMAVPTIERVAGRVLSD